MLFRAFWEALRWSLVFCCDAACADAAASRSFWSVSAAGPRLPGKVRPVMYEAIRRMVRERQRMTRETLAGREWYVSAIVPKVRMTRRVVIRWKGGRVRPNQMGVMARRRRKSAVRAGDVVEDVAVIWVERKSVRARKGARRRLERWVRVVRVCRIESRDLWCLVGAAFCWVEVLEGERLWEDFEGVSSEEFREWVVELDEGFVKLVESEEKRRLYIPRTSPTAASSGPSHRMTTSP